MHIDVEQLHHGDFKHGINPRLIDEARNIDDNGARVEGQNVCKGHQRTRTIEKFLSQSLLIFLFFSLLYGRVVGGEAFEKRLKIRCPLLLTATIIGVVVEKKLSENVAIFLVVLEDVTLLLVVVEFAAVFPF